MSKQLERVGI